MSNARTPPLFCAVPLAMAVILSCLVSPAAALSDPTNAELEALRQANANVLVLEYYNADGKSLVAKQSFTSPERAQFSNGTSYRFGQSLTLNAWGVSPCQHDRRLTDAKFDGPCREFVREGLNAILRSGPVMLCRAFADQQDKPVKNASCFILVSYASVYGVTKVEEYLVSGGYVSLIRDADGKPLRPDLADDERIAKGFGRGLWSFEHERIRRDQKP
jgi:endonuclease YncB( thermonuclease family)